MPLFKAIWPFARLATKRFFYRLLPDRIQLHLIYMGYMRKLLHLRHPETFNEKMQVAKISPLIKRMQPLTDKIAVREFVKARIGSEYLIPVHGTYSGTDEIKRNELPDRFVMKCTHDSGSVFVCNDIASLDFDDMIHKLKKALARKYFRIDRKSTRLNSSH